VAERRPPPFFTGGPIPTAQAERHLHGFEEERRTIVQALNRRETTSLGVFGGRGSGKTSLLLAVAPQLPGRRAHLECARVWPGNRNTFYRLLGEAIGTPRSHRTPQGAPAQAYANLPVPRRGSRGVLVLENADRLEDIDPGLVEALPALIARVPFTVVLTGRPEPLEAHVASAVYLRPFSEATTHDFLVRRLTSAGLGLEEDAVPVFYEFTRGEPDPLQRLGLATWRHAVEQGLERIGPEDVETAVFDVVDHLPTETVTAWAAVRGHMRDIFVAMCLHDLQRPTQIARRLDLEPKNVVVLLGRLADAHGLVERFERGAYRVIDPLLKHYVRKEWATPILR
jgi:hypothetical protein